MEKIVIKNGNISVTVLTLGAIIQRINAFGAELTAGYATEQEYFEDTCYFGGIVGRTANRCGSRHCINGNEYTLPLNEKGINHLHGGNEGFNLKRWSVIEKGDDFVTLYYRSQDGEEGYPGNLDVYVTYKLVGDALLISYKAKTDKPTWVNLTNHSYFNPFGINNKAGARIGGALIQIFADRVSVYDENSRVAGSVSVEGTEYDLREKYLIERYYDHNFYISGDEYERFGDKELRKAAKVYGSVNIECFTDMPCVQLYCGEFIPEGTRIFDGTLIGNGSALCLETQYEPNLQARGEGILTSDGEYNSATAYRFSLGNIHVVEK